MTERARMGISGRLAAAFQNNPLTPILAVMGLLLGLLAVAITPREEEPQIDVTMANVIVPFDGASSRDVEQWVATPLEQKLSEVEGVKHVYSISRPGMAVLTVEFEVGVPRQQALVRLYNQVFSNADFLPQRAGVGQPIVKPKGIDDVPVMALTLWSDDPQTDATRLAEVAHTLEAELKRIPGTRDIYTIGAPDRSVLVTLDAAKLAAYGMGANDLAQALQAANLVHQAGERVDAAQGAVPVTAGRYLANADDVANLVIGSRDGKPILLSDVASIELRGDLATRYVWYGAPPGRAGPQAGTAPAVTIAIAKKPGSNASDITNAVAQRLQQLKGELIPAGVHVSVTRDYGATASDKAQKLIQKLVFATGSVVLLVLFALGWREAIVVGAAVILTLAVTLFASKVMGFTLNRVSLFALIFSIGILVDDAIVVIENIARHWGMGDTDRRETAIEAVIEVGNPTIVATLTVVVALLPMLFVSGMMGPYMSPIPSNASVAMIFSFFVAVTVTPWLMLKVAGRAPLHHEAEGQGGRLGRTYAAIARPVLASKGRAWLFLGGVIVLTFGSLALFYTRDVTVKLLPFDNKSELSVTIDLPEGAAVETTDAVAQAVAGVAMELPEVVSVQTHAAAAAPFNFNGLVRHSFYRTQPHQGEVAVNLSAKHDRDRSSHQIALDLRARIQALPLPEGTVLKVVEPPPGPPVMATLLAEVYGPDPETRRAVGEKVEAAFRSVPFIVDVDNSWGDAAPRLRVLISPDDLDFYGVAESDVFDSIAILNGSTTVGYSHRGEGRAPIPIRVERPRDQRVPGEDFLTTPIPADLLPGNRGVVELGDVVRIEDEDASHILFRHNGRPAEMVTAELAGDFEAPLYGMMAVRDALEAQDWAGLPKPEIRLRGQPEDDSASTLLWDGEWEVTWVTFRDMGGAFAVALLGIYILVVAQFGSFRLPLVILTPVPLTFIGILGGHWLFGAPFSAPSMIGFIALAGIIVRNSILLVDFIRHDTTGRPLTEVLIDAGAVRFRPILLTALAAMIGAAVILTDPIFQGLAISLFFGLISSTLLTVLVIPAVYRVFRT